MGADTVVWLAVSAAAIKQSSGLFFQGQKLLLVPTVMRIGQELKLLLHHSRGQTVGGSEVVINSA